MNYKTFKTKAIVIREKEIGEANKLFTLYTEDFGKINILAKGIRKSKAKLRGGFQLLNFVSLEFIKGKFFFIATDAILTDDFLGVKKEIKKFRFGVYICNVLDELIKGEEKDKRIWNLFFEVLCNLRLSSCPTCFKRIKIWKTDSLEFIVRCFEWNLFCFLGFEPELHCCVVCRKRIQQGKIYFSLMDGGVLCAECRNKKKEAKEISRDVIKILRLIIMQDEKVLRRLRISFECEKELKEISKGYIEHILEKEIFVV